MQALILAAGMGNRLGKYTKNNTKCMLSINGKTLAERALDALDAAGVTSCVFVVGYKKDNVTAFLGERYKNVSITYIANDIYDKTNNIYSLYLARDVLLRDDTLLLESDLIFEPRIITALLASPAPAAAAVARYEPWMDGTVVQLTDSNAITSFIPKSLFDYAKKDTYYKTVNIYKFSRAFSRAVYVPFLEAYTTAMGANEYYEQVLRVITTLDAHEITAVVLDGQKWYEIDDAQDKAIAETIFSASPKERLERIQSAYGGYWRFPGLLDFCYLVNPYFPPPQMLSEMKSCFAGLLASYPSGLAAQNLLGAKLLNLGESSVLTGNGAAELIRALSPSVRGSIGIVFPTFNEYPESFASNEIAPFFPENFSYTKEDLISLSEQCDNLLLINPDNPSGNFIPPADVLALAAALSARGKKLILDESFADFAGGAGNSSALTEEALEAFPNIVGIKSLSKSYGVPGLRLGLLASGDKKLIGEVRRRLSIWNINSFAEFFLQIIGKYQKDYRKSCEAIGAERERFGKRLAALPFLQVFPSRANYFLCRVTGKLTAPALAEMLLDRYDIFIKDLTGKRGFPDSLYIRLAVRDTKDDDKLLECLEEIFS